MNPSNSNNRRPRTPGDLAAIRKAAKNEDHSDACLKPQSLTLHRASRGAAAVYRLSAVSSAIGSPRKSKVAVGTAVARRPPRGSRRAELPHRALALDQTPYSDRKSGVYGKSGDLG